MVRKYVISDDRKYGTLVESQFSEKSESSYEAQREIDR